jgi:AcrR family transcriptional regulator
MLQPRARIANAPAAIVPEPNAAKQARLLEAAAQEFNARGISGASIARIARTLGLTRAAVYYYVKDRDDLAARCYRQTCAAMAADLDAASAGRANGLDRILAFLRRSLDPSRAPLAALSELDYFGSRVRGEIAAAQARNVDGLRGMIRDGIADGSIRACDDEIIAQTLIGTIAWIPLSVDWVEGTDATYRARTAAALADMIVNGQAADPNFEFAPHVRIESFFPPAPQAFDRRGNADAKIEQVLMTASRLFNRRGIDGTSIDDVMAELGATKGALYHYFENKTDLVVRCHKRGFVLYERFADAAEEFGRCGLERGLIGLYLNIQAQARELSPLIHMVGCERACRRRHAATVPAAPAHCRSGSCAFVQSRAWPTAAIRPAGFRCCGAVERRRLPMASQVVSRRRRAKPASHARARDRRHCSYKDCARDESTKFTERSPPATSKARDAFAANFAREGDYREVGASFAAFHRGRCVVDVWGGFRDQRAHSQAFGHATRSPMCGRAPRP